jgi:hypothetical protein
LYFSLFHTTKQINLSQFKNYVDEALVDLIVQVSDTETNSVQASRGFIEKQRLAK